MRRFSTGIGIMFAVPVLFTAHAQAQLCGGERCLSSQFCQLPEGVCDPAEMPEQGLCVDVPLYCDGPYEPVCGCDGESYRSLCESQMASTSLKHEGDCDEILWFMFAAQDELTWRDTAEVSFYNLYRKIVAEWPPADFGDCLQENISDNSAFVVDDPPGAGELWLFLVTGQFPEGEGGMGHITTDCSLRVPQAACGR